VENRAFSREAESGLPHSLGAPTHRAGEGEGGRPTWRRLPRQRQGGHQAEKGWTIVDAGWMAMSRDRGTQRQKVDYGYGAVCDADGNVIEGLVLAGANQEHGIVSRMDGKVDPDMAMRLPIGRRLRILPNHACATGAQFAEYQAITAHGVAQQWRRFDGW
jgi:threo-3-hydroxy-D-aspartate ammonia-lyase